MRKNMKKVMATTLVAGMAVAAFAGCTSTPKTSSMADVMTVAGELESYSYSYELSAKASDGDFITVELFGDCTGDAISMGFKAEGEGADGFEMDYNVKDVLVCTTDAVYLNLKEIEDEFLAGMDLGTYGIDADWIKIDYGMEMEMDSSKELTETIAGDIEEAFADMIEEDDGEYVLEIKDNETAVEFLEVTAALLEDNGDDWADLMVSVYNDFDYQAFVSGFMSNLLMEMNTHFDLGMTKSEIEDGIEEAMGEIDFSELEIDASMYTDMFDEIVAGIEESKDDVELNGAEIVVKAYQDGSEYVTEAEVVFSEEDYDGEVTDYTVEIKSTIVAEDVEVEIPSDDVMAFEEVVCVLIEEFAGEIEADDVDDLIGSLEDSFSDIDVDDMMSSVVSPDMEGFDEDINWDEDLDWDEDFDWDEEW